MSNSKNSDTSRPQSAGFEKVGEAMADDNLFSDRFTLGNRDRSQSTENDESYDQPEERSVN